MWCASQDHMLSLGVWCFLGQKFNFFTQSTVAFFYFYFCIFWSFNGLKKSCSLISCNNVTRIVINNLENTLQPITITSIEWNLPTNLFLFIVLVALSFCSFAIIATFYMGERSISIPFKIFDPPLAYQLHRISNPKGSVDTPFSYT